MNPITLVVLLLGSLSGTEPLAPVGGGAQVPANPVPAATVPAQPTRTAAEHPSAGRGARTDMAESLRRDLEAMLRSSRLDRGAGVLVVSLDRGDTLFSHHADTALVPASNLKLYTSLAALHYLGPTFRYTTYLLATGTVRDGVLEGDLVLYGTGDPTLSDRYGQAVLEAFVDTLAALGIREIRGDVVGDASFFGGPGYGIGWQESYSNALYAAPASALSLSENVATIEIVPASRAGAQPAIRLVPGGDGLELLNQARTVASGRTRVRFGRAGYEGPLTVTGNVSRRSGAVRYRVPVADPPLYAAAVLREIVESRGVVVTGRTRSVQAAEGSALAGRSLFAPAAAHGAAVRILSIHTSPPLADVLEVVNKRSNNFMAEQVARTVGRVVLGDGTVEGGTRALARFGADVLGLDSTSFQPFDGSGLSPLNRTTAGAVVALLKYASDSSLWDPFWQTLPQTGARDGLRRMLGTPAEGRVWAKTGTIRQVSALSGYVQTVSGEWLAFSILNNRATSATQAKRLEDRIVARLARFDRATEASIGEAEIH